MREILNFVLILIAVTPLTGQIKDNYSWHNPLDYVNRFEFGDGKSPAKMPCKKREIVQSFVAVKFEQA